ncbi:MAG: stage V sporulation protein E, partial [Acidimicrobiia bacterium]|nr:stage V sporulation protein E [Acidimicrobiia bacterium]
AIPVTGLALPLVSVGGSAMLVAMAGVGILVNVARNAPHVPDPVQERRKR